MGSIGFRLRQERERLGLSQSELADRTGTTRKSQFNYETDARRPDADYLALAVLEGINVNYVLTGEREGAPPVTLSGEELLLLEYYRDAAPAVRKAAMAALLSGASSLPASTGGMNMSNLGDGNVQIGGSVGGSVRVKKGK